MPDDDSQTARGDDTSEARTAHLRESFGMSERPAIFSDPTARTIGALNGLGFVPDAPPIRLSIPGELHFEILGTPTSEQLEEYARLIRSLIVVAQLAAEQRSET